MVHINLHAVFRCFHRSIIHSLRMGLGGCFRSILRVRAHLSLYRFHAFSHGSNFLKHSRTPPVLTLLPTHSSSVGQNSNPIGKADHALLSCSRSGAQAGQICAIVACSVPWLIRYIVKALANVGRQSRPSRTSNHRSSELRDQRASCQSEPIAPIRRLTSFALSLCK